MKSLPCANCGTDVRTRKESIEVFVYHFKRLGVLGMWTWDWRSVFNRGTVFCNEECHARYAIRRAAEAGIGVEVAVS